jgi:hypothetical protein
MLTIGQFQHSVTTLSIELVMKGEEICTFINKKNDRLSIRCGYSYIRPNVEKRAKFGFPIWNGLRTLKLTFDFNKKYYPGCLMEDLLIMFPNVNALELDNKKNVMGDICAPIGFFVTDYSKNLTSLSLIQPSANLMIALTGIAFNRLQELAIKRFNICHAFFSFLNSFSKSPVKKLVLDAIICEVNGKIHLQWPQLEEISLSRMAFTALDFDQSMNSIKKMRIYDKSSSPSCNYMWKIFDKVSFSGLHELILDVGQVMGEIFNTINSSAPNLEILVLNRCKESTAFHESLYDGRIFVNLKFLKYDEYVLTIKQI